MSVLVFLSTHILENFKWDKMGNWVWMKIERKLAWKRVKFIYPSKLLFFPIFSLKSVRRTQTYISQKLCETTVYSNNKKNSTAWTFLSVHQQLLVLKENSKTSLDIIK